MQTLIKIDPETKIIVFNHRLPFDPLNGLQKSREELINEGGIFIDSFPEPENRIGMRGIPYYNSDSNTVYYKYIPIPLSTTERLDMMEEAFNELVMMSMSKEEV